jgi:hypothetical protein
MPTGTIYTPWLYLDGTSISSSYTSWPTLVTNRMNLASPVTESIWGNYNTQSSTGTVYARFRNDSNANINAKVIFVVTEDNITYAAPNGDNTHNHVARAYLPNTSGTPITVRIGEPVTVSQPFTLQSNWNLHNVEIVAMIQDTVQGTNSTRQILQAAMIEVVNLPSGVEESENDLPISSFVKAVPNPSANGTQFAFSLPAGTHYTISIFDAAGRNVKTLSGNASGKNDFVQWTANTQSGIYFYRFESNVTNTSGKIIVK